MDRFKKQEMRRESLAKVRKEILAERAAALARITRTLERHLARLHYLRREVRSTRGAERETRRAAYEKTRGQARTYLWYLKVQREVNGLYDNEGLERRYRIPGPLGRP
jgi:hypothetical protein